MKPRIIAFYLPQFHPIPENDAWWGKGFTEWTNVRKAAPCFPGHYQPHVPGQLGYYDLRNPEVRQAQAELARAHGIHGFCYYHYWFNGKMLLERPFNEVLHSGEPDFPFCLCWANENWTRRWDGLDQETLITQDYVQYDPIEHITWLAKAFADQRYIKVNGKPVFLVYRSDQIPNMKAVISTWRQTLSAQGFPDICLCAVKNMQFALGDEETLALGFDALIDFQPSPNDVQTLVSTLNKFPLFSTVFKIVRPFLDLFMPKLRPYANCSYKRMVESVIAKPPFVHKTFPTVFPSWDNSPRRKSNVTIIQNDDADLYGQWLADSLKRVQTYPPEEQMVFINAWNEWGEGCHLEPDLRNGNKFLEATRQAIATCKNQTST